MKVAVDYEYDVFFSYKRHDQTAEWTRRIQELLRLWLSQEMGAPMKMFVDVNTIEVGEKWPETIKLGLQRSKCMVGVWSPLYFQSPWCVSEWRSFLAREKTLDLDSHGLIAPIRFHDGDSFPHEARQVQSLDFTPYASALPAFWSSPRSLDLEDQIKILAKSVAKILDRAPPFNAEWPVIETAGDAPPKIPLGRL